MAHTHEAILAMRLVLSLHDDNGPAFSATLDEFLDCPAQRSASSAN